MPRCLASLARNSCSRSLAMSESSRAKPSSLYLGWLGFMAIRDFPAPLRMSAKERWGFDAHAIVE